MQKLNNAGLPSNRNEDQKFKQPKIIIKKDGSVERDHLDHQKGPIGKDGKPILVISNKVYGSPNNKQFLPSIVKRTGDVSGKPMAASHKKNPSKLATDLQIRRSMTRRDGEAFEQKGFETIRDLHRSLLRLKLMSKYGKRSIYTRSMDRDFAEIDGYLRTKYPNETRNFDNELLRMEQSIRGMTVGKKPPTIHRIKNYRKKRTGAFWYMDKLLENGVTQFRTPFQ